MVEKKTEGSDQPKPRQTLTKQPNWEILAATGVSGKALAQLLNEFTANMTPSERLAVVNSMPRNLPIS